MERIEQDAALGRNQVQAQVSEVARVAGATPVCGQPARSERRTALRGRPHFTSLESTNHPHVAAPNARRAGIPGLAADAGVLPPTPETEAPR